MYIEYNPNPKSRQTGDCVIRAVSKVNEWDWDTAYIKIVEQGFKMKGMPTENYVWEKFLLLNGYQKKMLPDTCPECYTIKQFCDEHKKGTFLLATGSHVVAVINGDYYDTWDSGDEVPIYYFQKEG